MKGSNNMLIRMSDNVKEAVECISKRGRSGASVNVSNLKFQFRKKFNKPLSTEDAIAAFKALQAAGFGYVAKKEFISEYGVKEAANGFLSGENPTSLKKFNTRPRVAITQTKIVEVSNLELARLRAENEKLKKIISDQYLQSILK